jgi:hypothetical protein
MYHVSLVSCLVVGYYLLYTSPVKCFFIEVYYFSLVCCLVLGYCNNQAPNRRLKINDTFLYRNIWRVWYTIVYQTRQMFLYINVSCIFSLLFGACLLPIVYQTRQMFLYRNVSCIFSLLFGAWLLPIVYQTRQMFLYRNDKHQTRD